MMWAVLLWLVFAIMAAVGSNFHAAASSNNNNNDDKIRLRVDLQTEPLRNAPSCVHSFSLLELHNVHAKDTIVVHSLKVGPESMAPIDDIDNSSSSAAPPLLQPSTLPPQLQVVSHLTEPLTLTPGQAAIVPVSFLPHYPTLIPDYTSDTTTDPVSADFADLVDWLGYATAYEMYVRQHERHERYDVRGAVHLDTNFGIMPVPLQASSVRYNAYGVPDSILLEAPSSSAIYADDTVPSTYQIVQVMERASATRKGRKRHKECFDLYMQHAEADARHDNHADMTNQALLVKKVLASRPDLVHLTHRDGQMGYRGVLRPTHDMRNLSAIPRDGQEHYVASICWGGCGAVTDFEQLDAMERSLVDEMNSWEAIFSTEITSSSDRSDSDSDSNDNDDVKGYVNLLGYVAVVTDRTTVYVRVLEHVRSNPTSKTAPTSSSFCENEQAAERISIARTLAEIRTSTDPQCMRLLRQDVLDLWLTHRTEDRTASIEKDMTLRTKISNASGRRSYQIMRASLGVDTTILNATSLAEAGISVNLIHLFKNAISVSVRVNWERLKLAVDDLDSFTLQGILTIRATSMTDIEYSEWEHYISRGGDRQSECTLHIPFRLQVAQGAIGLVMHKTSHDNSDLWSTERWNDFDLDVVSAAFFPYPLPVDSSGLNRRRSQAEKKMIQHSFEVVGRYDVDVRLETAKLVPSENESREQSVCSHFEVKVSPMPPIRQSNGLFSLGMVTLQYTCPPEALRGNESSDDDANDITRVCNLLLATKPNSGDFVLPLVMYNGRLEMSASIESLYVSVVDNAASAPAWRRLIDGLGTVVQWVNASKFQKAMLSIMSMGSAKVVDIDASVLGRYLYTLGPKDANFDGYRLRPFLVDAGAIEYDQVERVPLYITNYNPVAVVVTADVSAVDGFSVRLGRDSYNIRRRNGDRVVDYLPRVCNVTSVGDPAHKDAEWQRKNYSAHVCDGLKRFLTTEPLAESFLNKFRYRNAVSGNEEALSKYPWLQSLYHRKKIIAFRTTASVQPAAGGHKGDKSLPIPSEYSAFAALDSSVGRGPFISSSDGKSYQCLSESESSESFSTLIPPGAVARFDLEVRAPPKGALGNDMTEFVATGLLLSTDAGEVMPLIVHFKALLGKLQLSEHHSGQALAVNKTKARILEVASNLFTEKISADSTSAITIPPIGAGGTTAMSNVEPSAEGYPIIVSSTFDRNLFLNRVISCNPWFEVLPAENINDGLNNSGGTAIGSVHFLAQCGGELNGFSTSFFGCALKLLAAYDELQPEGCGLRSMLQQSSDTDPIRRRFLDRAILAFSRAERTVQVRNRALHFSGDNSRLFAHLSDALVEGSRWTAELRAASVYAEAWTAWRAVVESGLNDMSTSLRADVDYDSPEDGSRQSLTLTLHDAIVRSEIVPPRLLNLKESRLRQILFSYDIATPKSTIIFPKTEVGASSELFIPIRNPTARYVRVKLTTSSGTEFEEELSSLTKNTRAPYICGRTSPPGRSGGVDEMWWSGDGGYFLLEHLQDSLRSTSQHRYSGIRSSVHSLTTPSKEYTNFLSVGYEILREENDDLETPGQVGAFAARQSTDDARGMTFDEFDHQKSIPTSFAIPVNSLDELIIPPHGAAELGPIYFRPTNSLQSQNNSFDFETYVILENSLTGTERINIRGPPSRRRLVIRGIAGARELQWRDGHFVLSFTGTKSEFFDAAKSGFVLSNEGSTPVRFDRFSFSQPTIDGTRMDLGCVHEEYAVVDCREASFFPVVILPGESRQIVIELRPSGTTSGSYVRLDMRYEVKNPLRPSQQPVDAVQVETILVRYDMPAHISSTLCSDPTKSPTERPLGDTRHVANYDRISSIASWILMFAIGIAATKLAFRIHRIGMLCRFVKSNMQLRRGESNALVKLNWAVAYRCLGRVDPGAHDLHTLGREQTKHVILPNYMTRGLALPHCINQSGALQRDRAVLGRRSGCAGGSDRARTLSDALFRNYCPPRLANEEYQMPVSLDWRVALSRNILNQSVVGHMKLPNRAQALLQTRLEQSTSFNESASGSFDVSLVSDGTEDDSEYETFHTSGHFDLVEEKAVDDTMVSPEETSNENGTSSIKLERHAHGTTKFSGDSDATVSVESNADVKKEDERSPRHANGSRTVQDRPSGKAATPRSRRTKERLIKTPAHQNGATQAKTIAGAAHRGNKSTAGNRSNRPGRQAPKSSDPTRVLHSNDPTDTAPAKINKTVISNVKEESSEAITAAPSAAAALTEGGARAPPGLAPPPGFESGGASLQGSSSFLPLASTGALTTGIDGLNEAAAAASLRQGTDRPPALSNRNISGASSVASSDAAFLSDALTPLSPYQRRNMLLSNNNAGHTSTLSFDDGSTVLPLTPSLDTILTQHHPDSGTDFASGQPAPSSGGAFFSHESGFDVMDFLDGILNDGSSTASGVAPSSMDRSSPFTLPMAPTVGNNPWAAAAAAAAAAGSSPVHPHRSAAATRSSRAANYGIAFMEQDPSDHHDSLVEPVQLLTPDMILAAAASDDQDDQIDPSAMYASYFANLVSDMDDAG